jgi:hypothetical protein
MAACGRVIGATTMSGGGGGDDNAGADSNVSRGEAVACIDNVH